LLEGAFVFFNDRTHLLQQFFGLLKRVGISHCAAILTSSLRWMNLILVYELH
jgi:hypothetical protein